MKKNPLGQGLDVGSDPIFHCTLWYVGAPGDDGYISVVCMMWKIELMVVD